MSPRGAPRKEDEVYVNFVNLPEEIVQRREGGGADKRTVAHAGGNFAHREDMDRWLSLYWPGAVLENAVPPRRRKYDRRAVRGA